MPTPAQPQSTDGTPSVPARDGALRDDASLLERFVWRMGSHGMSVSRRLMITDPAYAVQQLAQARQLRDAELNDLALTLFARFLQQRSGLLNIH